MDPQAEEELVAIRFAEELSRYMQTSPYHLSGLDSKARARLGEQSNVPLDGLAGIGSSVVEVDRYSDRYLLHVQAADKKGKLHAINTGTV